MEFTVLQQIYYETQSITRTGFTAFLNPNGDIWWDNNGQLLTYYRMQTLFILANIQAKALAQVSQRTVQAWRCAARRHWRIQGVVMVAFRITLRIKVNVQHVLPSTLSLADRFLRLLLHNA